MGKKAMNPKEAKLRDIIANVKIPTISELKAKLQH